MRDKTPPHDHRLLRSLPGRARMLGLAGAAVVGAGLLVPTGSPSAAEPVRCGPSPVPTFFADETRQPPVAAPDWPGHYTLTAHVDAHSFHSEWPAVRTLGYSAPGAPMQYLGPTIVTERGKPIDVTVVNGLPPAGTPIFPFDQPDDRNSITMHRHAGLQPAPSDGVPAPLQPEIPPGGSMTNHFPNDQAAGPLWYHDHAHRNTSYHVYAGLAGFSPNTDEIEAGFPLPRGEFAQRFAIQDKKFKPDATLCYNHADPEFFGDLPVVNGTVAPKSSVEPRRYTFTLLNASDSRSYRFGLRQAGGQRANVPRMTVVGNDSGYLLHPAPVSELLVAPAERYVVVVDFTGHEAENWVLTNNAPAPLGDLDEVDPDGGGIPQIMRFDVGTSSSSPDHSQIPEALPETNNGLPPEALLPDARLRTVQAAEATPGVPQLGDRDRLLDYHDEPTETPQLDSAEVWAMRNRSPDAHPIHLHMVELRLIGRWHVGRWDADGRPVPGTIGPFEPPRPHETGPKETFVSPPDYITAWVGRFTLPGTTVWHCHILSHEDGAMSMVEMMRPMVVGSAPQTQLPLVGSRERLDELIRQP
ncbi:spore coat protein A [Saccharopolyspora shandongensis]|uniref:Spore coat protein A n=1 Tax=Saccharopolyspora shandongensis TaxID=418495 RepID=A0A1H3R0C5_9PSEU|nr:multicopper oxidase domain-containing protein [Saccharopolyspora shandongensis]SDZ18698.1 spore coat protein A [Saccharopolyspora shandongensis]